MSVHGGLIKAFLTTLPFTLVGVLGAYNQIAPNNFDTPEYGEALGQRVNEYCEPVGLTNRLLRARRGGPNSTTAKQVATVWVQKYESGKLVDLPPTTGGDSTRDGVKQQILAAKATVLSDLIRAADLDVVAGHPDRAIPSYMLSLRLIRVMMFSDLTSLGNGISLENCVLRRLSALEQDISHVIRPTGQPDIDKALAAEFRAAISDQTLTSEQRARMSSQFKRAITRTESLRQILDDPKNDYQISLLFANAKRLQALVAMQHKIITAQNQGTSRALAHSIFGTTPGSI